MKCCNCARKNNLNRKENTYKGNFYAGNQALLNLTIAELNNSG